MSVLKETQRHVTVVEMLKFVCFWRLAQSVCVRVFQSVSVCIKCVCGAGESSPPVCVHRCCHRGPWCTLSRKTTDGWTDSLLHLLPPTLCAVLELSEAEENLLQ